MDFNQVVQKTEGFPVWVDVLSVSLPCNRQKPRFGSEWCNLIPEVFPFNARIMETTSQGEKQWQKITSREC